MNDMRHVGKIILYLLIAALVLCPLIWTATAKAADFMVQTSAYRPYGAGPLDSCRIYVQGGWDAGNLDSTQRYLTFPISRPSGAGNVIDTMVRYAVVTFASLDADYNPQVFALWWFDSDPEPVPDNACNITVNGVNVSVVLDSSQIQDIIDAINQGAGGLGDFPETLFVYDSLQDALVVGARVFVFSQDTTCCQNGSGGQYTGLDGSVVYSLDAGTFPVAISSQGFFQEGAYQLVTTAGPGGRDTVMVYSHGFTAPSGGDSCTVVIFTNDPLALAYVSIKENDHQDTSGVILTPHVEAAPADGNGVIEVTLPRTSATRQHSRWKFEIKDAYNVTMATVDDYEVPDQAVDTLLVEEER